MVFTSNVFLFLFLPLFLVLYYLTPERWKSLTIVAGSYLFYAWWRPDFLLLFIGLAYWNYWFGLLIKTRLDQGQEREAFRWLALGVVGDLATLGYFKYANFGVEVIAGALAPLGIDTFTLEYIILPLGISFYIFQAISYLVDIYRRDATPTHRLIDFAAFMCLFPQLIAGPILRYSSLDQQLRQRSHSWELFSLGACRFMLGFIKKVLIADSLAPLGTLYLGESDLQMTDAWFGSLVSLLQLYFDFSGYSDMAIGLGMMMGFRFQENFNQPLLSQSLTEFWRRWHMTLGGFLRDYVYLPLVRTGRLGGNTALFVTMVLSGFWHGASFAFIFFGVYFAVFMVLERRFGLTTSTQSPYRLGRNLLTVLMIVFCMPLFVTGNLRHSLEIYTGLIGLRGLGSLDLYLIGTSQLTLSFVALAILWVAVAGASNRRFYAAATPQQSRYFMQHVQGMASLFLWTGFALAISRLAANTFSPFLYFQF